MGPSDNTVGIIAILSIFVFFPIAVSLARLIWRRASAPPPPPAIPYETTQRLADVQTSLDAMALEIERISEGQRFVTKVLSERPTPALPSAERSKPGRKSS